MLNWGKRLAEWRTVLALKGVKVSPWALVHAVLSGPVPAEVWRGRIWICHHCPIYDKEHKACLKRMDDGRVLGCHCYVPFLALTAAPYTKNGGCWAREVTKKSDFPEGWPAYTFWSRWEKIGAVWRFIFAR